MFKVLLKETDHVHVHMQIFSSVLRKYFRNTSAEVSLLLARAFYDADQMPQARRALLRAVHLNPTDMQLRFNVALVLQVLPCTPALACNISVHVLQVDVSRNEQTALNSEIFHII